jgi:hypothetical protein
MALPKPAFLAVLTVGICRHGKNRITSRGHHLLHRSGGGARRNPALSRRDSANPPTAPASAAPMMATAGKLRKNSCQASGLGACVLFKSALPHARPHEPQLFGSVRRLVQMPYTGRVSSANARDGQTT